MRTIVLAASVLLACIASAANIGQGRTIAAEACSACHKVTAAQVAPAPVRDADERDYVAAPSFAMIASTANDEAALRGAITAPKHPMREQEWLAGDLDDVVAYIRSLRGQKW